ncbi:anti-sigma factor (plasmid) [Fulvitalea axinellae]|uniref:Anti-sigma factor n=1 Tax=Fulvitalea axinellae TaxID=1182444 RepID=A0AAU9D727_9BACT|nr:anti-sigma factor [Fulvitalea axinellae]
MEYALLMRPDNDILYRYLTGDLDEAEKIQILEWLQDEDNFRDFQELRTQWMQTGLAMVDTDDFAPQISKVLAKTTRKKPTRTRKLSDTWVRIGRVAAVIAVVAGLSLFWKFYDQKPAFQEITYSTTYGQIKHITLEDGTAVTLNAKSKLSVLDMGQVRKVQLEGEGYFKVNSDPEHPFKVITPELSLVVTGTVFNVKAYPEDKAINTTLLEGKLSVKPQDKKEKGIVLKPGQNANYVKEFDFLSVEPANFRTATTWMENKISFRNETLEQIANSLGRWYNAEIILDEHSLDKGRYTGVILKNKPLEQSLIVISQIADCRYKIVNKDSGNMTVRFY